jgi:hypothetical protein
MELTLQKVKDCIAFQPPLKHTLENMVEIWYKIAKRDGASEQEAIMVALDKLGKTLLSWNK